MNTPFAINATNTNLPTEAFRINTKERNVDSNLLKYRKGNNKISSLRNPFKASTLMLTLGHQKAFKISHQWSQHQRNQN